MNPTQHRLLLAWLRKKQREAIKMRKREWLRSRSALDKHFTENWRQQGRADAFFEVLSYLRRMK